MIGLGYLGSQEPTGGYVIAARILTAYYFAFFFIILPLLGLVRDDQAAAEFDLGIGAARGVPIGASAPPPGGRG